MKALTTMLVERAMDKMEQPVDGLKVWRDAAQEQLPETVVDACLVSRPSSYAAGKAASQFGFLAYKALKKRQEIQAGGLPEHFVLAVTENEVVALRRTMKARGPQTGVPGEEVARWKRSDLQVTSRVSGYLYNVTIESPADGEKVQCCVVKSPLSESFLALLADPTSMRPAQAA
jgi:hypothetical protein